MNTDDLLDLIAGIFMATLFVAFLSLLGSVREKP